MSEASSTSTTTATNDPAAVYVRHTINRLTAATAKHGQNLDIWDYVHLLSVITFLDAAGHGDAVREAADRTAATYGLRPQSVVDADNAPAAILQRYDKHPKAGR